MVHLSLTGDYRNCSYVNADGQVHYVVETPSGSGCSKTVSTVKRPIGKDDPGPSKVSFTDVGEIAFDSSSPCSRSLIQLGGQEYEASHFFSKIGWKNDLGFTGLDGVDYKWRLKKKALQLVRRNSDKTPIALFHPKIIGWPRKPRPASLEIFSDGTHMVDLIVVTYVFAQEVYDSRMAEAQTSSRSTQNSQNPSNSPDWLSAIATLASSKVAY